MAEFGLANQGGGKDFEGNFSTNERGGVLLRQAPEGFEKLVTQKTRRKLDVGVTQENFDEDRRICVTRKK